MEDTGTKSPKPREVKIGFCYGLTGDEAHAGEDARRAYTLAIDEINRKGGIKSLGGLEIFPIWGNHRGKPELAMAEAERLITEDRVVTIFGARLSSCALRVCEVAERYRIPFCIGECSSPKLTSSGFKYTFNAGPHDILNTEMMFKFMKDLQKKKGVETRTVAYVYEDSVFGGGCYEAWKMFNTNLELGGYTVVADICYSAATTDVTSEVLKLKNAKPDCVLMASYAADAALYIKTYKKLNFNCKGILAYEGPTKPEYLAAVGELNNYVFARIGWVSDIKKNTSKDFVAKFKAAYGIEPYDSQTRQWQNLIIWCDAMERASSLDPDEIWEALKATDMPGEKLAQPWERVVFDDFSTPYGDFTNQNPYALPVIVQFLDGKYKTVYPRNLASSDLVFPVPKWEERS